jgi:hypothetical protein
MGILRRHRRLFNPKTPQSEQLPCRRRDRRNLAREEEGQIQPFGRLDRGARRALDEEAERLAELR